MENRRQHHAPFISDGGSVIADSAGSQVIIAATPDLATFIVKACNRYDNLMAAFDLCRGEINGHTLPHRTPSHKAFADIAKELQDDFDQHGK